MNDSPAESIESVRLESNIVWNGANPVPSDPSDAVNASDDPNGRLVDPGLPTVAPFTRPVWLPENGEFAGGHQSSCELFGALVTRFGRIGPTSPAAGNANAAAAPAIDIFGAQRACLALEQKSPTDRRRAAIALVSAREYQTRVVFLDLVCVRMWRR